MTGYPPPSYPPPSPYPPPNYPPPGSAAYVPGLGYGVTYSKPTDVLGRRIGAYAIDLAIGLVIFFVMFFSLASTHDFPTSGEATAFCDRFNDDPDILCTASGTTAFVIDSTELGAIMLAEGGFVLVNFVLLTGLTGFSLGKLMTGVRVVHQHTGQRCGLGRALLRTILLVVPDLAGLVGVIVAATNSERRRVGDMAAGTLVIHKRAIGQPPMRPAPASQVYAPGYPGGYPGYGYPSPSGYPSPPPPAWPAPAAPTPPPWVAPPAPTAPPAPAVEPWPDFGRPSADPDATSVFDTSAATDRHDSVDDDVTEHAHDAPTTAAGTTGTATGETSVDAGRSSADVGTAGEDEPAPGVGAPHWDTTRNTYIQWDPELAAWMQWDYAKNQWQPMR